MTMDQAATFLAGSILSGIGFVIIISTVVLINNILHRYWKPMSFFKWADYGQNSRFATEEELKSIEPTLEKKQK